MPRRAQRWCPAGGACSHLWPSGLSRRALPPRLRLLEAEDAEAKARAAEAERARFETLQAELAAELERQRALAALPRPEDAGSPCVPPPCAV